MKERNLESPLVRTASIDRKEKLSLQQKANEATSSTSKTEMAFRGVRSSKFRHVFGLPSKKESCFEGVRITKNAHDSNFCAVNPKYVAVVVESAGGGSFIVLPIDKTGRIDINTPKVCGHRGQVLDIKWDPFDDDVIASASEDTTIKIWRIPDGGLTTNLSEFSQDLRRHSRRVAFIEWHPTAEHVLASAGYDYKIILWKTNTASPLTIISCHPDTIYSFSFNRDGTQIATTCKDKNIRVIDARSGEVLEEGAGHQGPKSSKVAFLGNLNKLFTTGFSRGSDRQYAVWDANDLSKPLKMDAVDCSSGVLFPFYDHDTRVVFVAGKGDGNIRYYEIVDEKPYCHYLSEFKSSAPQRGLGFMPKRGVDPAKCEIMRFFKLYATKDFVEPISMIVPRKSEAFQDDLYPDCPGMIPSLTADEWKSGQSRDPILSSMRDKERNAVQFSRGEEGIISPPHNVPDPHLPPSDRASSVISGYGSQQQQQQQQQQLQQSSLQRRQSESHRIPGSIMNIAKNSASEAVVKIPTNRFNENGNTTSCVTTSSSATSHTTGGGGGGGGKNNNNSPAVRPGLDRANTIIGTTPTNFTQRNKQWSNLGSPTNGQPSWENVIPKTDSELRRAYFKLQDEVRDLKEQLSLKDRRILELENQLAQHHLTANKEITSSPSSPLLPSTLSSTSLVTTYPSDALPMLFSEAASNPSDVAASPTHLPYPFTTPSQPTSPPPSSLARSSRLPSPAHSQSLPSVSSSPDQLLIRPSSSSSSTSSSSSLNPKGHSSPLPPPHQTLAHPPLTPSAPPLDDPFPTTSPSASPLPVSLATLTTDSTTSTYSTAGSTANSFESLHHHDPHHLLELVVDSSSPPAPSSTGCDGSASRKRSSTSSASPSSSSSAPTLEPSATNEPLRPQRVVLTDAVEDESFVDDHGGGDAAVAEREEEEREKLKQSGCEGCRIDGNDDSEDYADVDESKANREIHVVAFRRENEQVDDEIDVDAEDATIAVSDSRDGTKKPMTITPTKTSTTVSTKPEVLNSFVNDDPPTITTRTTATTKRIKLMEELSAERSRGGGDEGAGIRSDVGRKSNGNLKREELDAVASLAVAAAATSSTAAATPATVAATSALVAETIASSSSESSLEVTLMSQTASSDC